ncbi:hypothetical protein BamIOP4010DRAFT_1323 [Burkholderia ambifaria IOP40-10]|uniref:Uncharacterized protein n=1 Tax=Burkholderia ambifaria IOP40-10 TaxID=396596 RepID=B1FBB4_9BURK|nr:hypothetical protein BamIOP4010DRAFT_1323 [Burkholderia ambifaria IOP40-10]
MERRLVRCPRASKVESRVSVLRILSKEHRRTQALFADIECRREIDADHVGALNVFAAGHAVLTCEKTTQPGRSEKPEPAWWFRRSRPEDRENPSGRAGCQCRRRLRRTKCPPRIRCLLDGRSMWMAAPFRTFVVQFFEGLASRSAPLSATLCAYPAWRECSSIPPRADPSPRSEHV